MELNRGERIQHKSFWGSIIKKWSWTSLFSCYPYFLHSYRYLILIFLADWIFVGKSETKVHGIANQISMGKSAPNRMKFKGQTKVDAISYFSFHLEEFDKWIWSFIINHLNSKVSHLYLGPQNFFYILGIFNFLSTITSLILNWARCSLSLIFVSLPLSLNHWDYVWWSLVKYKLRLDWNRGREGERGRWEK